MNEKITAVYLMVRLSELTPEDNGSYERPQAEQREECLRFVEEKLGESKEKVEVYTRRNQLIMDIERDRIKRLVVEREDRLGGNEAELEGILFELEMRGIELLSLRS